MNLEHGTRNTEPDTSIRPGGTGSSVSGHPNPEPETRNPEQQKHPCLFIKRDTTGEKDFEEFYTDKETLNMDRFQNLGIIKNELENFDGPIDYFEHSMRSLKERMTWSKQEIVDLFHYMIPGFEHKEVGRYLDSKM